MGIFDNQTYAEIAERSKADISGSLPGLDPRISASFIKALAVSTAGRHHDNVLLLKQILKEVFPQTAESEDTLKYYLEYEGLTPLAPTESSGKVSFPGTLGTVIDVDQEFKTENDIRFLATEQTECQEFSFQVSLLTRSGKTVTAVTTEDHIFASGLTITVTGADQPDYNGDHIVTVLGSDSFSYEIATQPVSPASGNISASFIGASIPIEAVLADSKSNVEAGTLLTAATSPPSGLGSNGYVQLGGTTGGTDAESNEDQLERLMYSRANPVANFNISAVTLQARLIQGVTRVFIKPASPYAGAAEIYFMRDRDDNPIPTPTQITEVKDKILEIKPITNLDSDIFVKAPTPVFVNFSFTSLTPESFSDDGKNAIAANLKAFFLRAAEFGKPVSADLYRSVIMNTIDPVTGETLKTFVLSEPTGDIAIEEPEIALVQSVTFPP